MTKLMPLVFLFACNSPHSSATPDAADNEGDAGPRTPIALVAAGDFTAGDPGTLASISVATQTVKENVAPAGAVGDDPMLRVFGDELFIVSRADGNNVTILGRSTKAFLGQLATGAGSNPQDVAVLGDTLYVPVYGGAGVAVLGRDGSSSMIDLSSYDPDGLPNCVSVYLVGTSLYIACEIADDANFFTPRGPGKVFVYDTTSDAITATVTMTTVNPFGVFAQLPSGDLVIPTVDFTTSTGCIERITTGATPTSAGCMVMNAAMSASFVERIEIDHDMMWLAVAGTYPHANLQSYNMTSSTLSSAPLSPDTETIVDVAACPDGTLVVSDATMNDSGVRIYRDGHEVTTDVLPVGLDTKSTNALICY